MSQYGVLVFSPAPADPTLMSADHLEALSAYPELVKGVGAKVLGASYFAGQRGFAFEASTLATTVLGEKTRSGPLVESDLVPAAFFVISAPNPEVAVEAARLHPAVAEGGVEVRPLVT